MTSILTSAPWDTAISSISSPHPRAQAIHWLQTFRAFNEPSLNQENEEELGEDEEFDEEFDDEFDDDDEFEDDEDWEDEFEDDDEDEEVGLEDE